MKCPDCHGELHKQHLIAGGKALATVWMCSCPVPHQLVHAARQEHGSADLQSASPCNKPSAQFVNGESDLCFDCPLLPECGQLDSPPRCAKRAHIG